jgi:hypothetical protein
MIAYLKHYILNKIQSIFGKENIKQLLNFLNSDQKQEPTIRKKSTSSHKK